MVQWQLLKRAGGSCKQVHFSRCTYQQKRSLVNIKLKLVKDPVLDNVVAGGREVKATCILVSMIASQACHCVPIYHLNKRRGRLGLPSDLKLSTFIRRYPTIFEELSSPDSAGTPVPWFKLTTEAEKLHREECVVLQNCYVDILQRLRKLLMLTKDRVLPLQTIDQLKWDLGLPYDYHQSLAPNHPDLFSLVPLSDDRDGLKLLNWDQSLAVSHLEMNSVKVNGTFAFPIGFTRGYGLKRKCIKWLEEWQKLPYTSPYADASRLDPRTDESEKRIVGVFHELLHLTIQKKTERSNVSNLRKPLALPQKFTKVFERHPGIFYISRKGDTQTVVLREAYDRDQLIEKHPLAVIRERYRSMMKKGFLDRSRGLYKDDVSKSSLRVKENKFESEEDSDLDMLSEYESDETAA